jgi:type I restriction enzyme, S subunit
MNEPKLRFKEFEGKKISSFVLADIANIQVGRDLKENSFSEVETSTHCYPVYSNTVVNRGLYGFYDFEEYSGNSLTVVGRGIGLGTAFSRSSGFGAIGRLLVVSPKKDEFNVHFLADYINFKLIIHNESGGIPQLPGSTFGNYEVVLPCFEEQAKIASFLSAVDEKIAQLSRKCELLAQYKKGVMQQIFSQQLRFKDDDGKDFPEWEVIDLRQIATKVNKKNKDESLKYVLTNSATQGIVSQADYFERDIANQNNLGGYYIVEIDDFVYNPRISINAPVGPIKRNKLAVGVMSPLYTVFRFKEGGLEFFEQFFQTTHWHDYMKSISNYGARHDRMNISNESFFELPLPYPSKDEQTKIANFLSAIDDKITNAQAQLAAVKHYKQGLLQQMFV